MYDLFQEAGTPLPKDPNLVDYGFKFPDDFQAKNKGKKWKNKMVSIYVCVTINKTQ